MGKTFVLLWMVFNHVFDDYHLQGILANMKQKSWWQENAPQDMYKYDYIVALLMHSISWAFLIMLPIVVWNGFATNIGFEWAFIFNVAIHALVDDLKANKHRINLITDQSLHIMQIMITYEMFIGG